MAACIIALAPPLLLGRVLAADVKEGNPRTACWRAHACRAPGIACLLAKSLTAAAAHADMHAPWCPAAAVRGAGRRAINCASLRARYRHAPEHRPAREMLRNTGGSAITHLAGLSTHARGWASSLRGPSRYTSSASGVEVCDRGRLMLLVLSRCTTVASEQRPECICSRLSFSHSAALGDPSGCYTARHRLHR
jgi:hypothetical protein